MKKIGLADYGVGNRRSVRNALEALGAQVNVTSDATELDATDGLIIPGVGAFPHCMGRLQETGLDHFIRTYVATGKPVLGICVGMQMLFDVGTEFGTTRGLGLIPGEVNRLPIDPQRGRLPHIAWTSVRSSEGAAMFKGFAEPAKFYFVHSFAPSGVPADCISGEASYCGHAFAAAVEKANVWGTQFHPEKSGPSGLRLLGNFIAAC